MCLHWGSPVFLLPGKSFSNLRPQVTFFNRRIASGRGSSVGPSLPFRHMVEIRVTTPRKISRIEGSVPGTSRFRGDINLPVNTGPRKDGRGSIRNFFLLAPLWPSRPWFPRLLSLLVGSPEWLPVSPGLLHRPLSHQLHQHPDRRHLTLWSLSGSRDRRQVFLGGLPLLQQYPSDSPLEVHVLTIPDWQVFVHGVPVGVRSTFSFSKLCCRFLFFRTFR